MLIIFHIEKYGNYVYRKMCHYFYVLCSNQIALEYSSIPKYEDLKSKICGLKLQDIPD